MKASRFGLIFIVAAVFLVGFAGNASAFHSGGVAECAGCHSMHSPAPGGSFLLVGVDKSSACLTCHQNAADTGPSGYHISTAATTFGVGETPIQRTPGGDFAWLKKGYAFGSETEPGHMHGHNIVANDFGYVADVSNTVAPGGGTFLATQLACNSCHDPHGTFRRLPSGVISRTGGTTYASGSYPGAGNEPTTFAATGEVLSVGVYRLLAGAGYQQQGYAGAPVFTGVPAAKVPSTYNRTEATSQTRASYGVMTTGGHQTWSNWCATCHPEMHSSGHYTHVVDQNLGSEIAGNYNAYVKTGTMTGAQATSYSTLVPFAKTGTYADLATVARNDNAGTSLSGPSSSDQVVCLSCHRAHASGTVHALRFDIEYEFMVKNGLYTGTDNPAVGTTGRGPTQARGRIISEWQAHYYDRPATVFSSYQRALCNKCHAKD